MPFATLPPLVCSLVVGATISGASDAVAGGDFAPILVSPGAVTEELETDRRCPVFSWSPASSHGPDASGSRAQLLEVHRRDPLDGVRRSGEKDRLAERSASLVRRRRLPATLSSWSPAGLDCLDSGGLYEWSVALEIDGFVVARSEVATFHVRTGPSEAELAAALEVLGEALAPPRDGNVESISQHEDLSIPDSAVRPTTSRPPSPSGSRARTSASGGAAGARITTSGSLIASSFVGGPSPQLVGVTAVDLACNGCVGSSDFDWSVIQRRGTSACTGGISMIGQILENGSIVCNAFTEPRDLTGEGLAIATNGTSVTTSIGPLNPNYEICALTRVAFQEIEGSSERARCEVDLDLSGGNERWEVTATTTSGADAQCGARCFRN